MRIGFFTDGFLPQPNGVATSVYESAKELERRGHEVVIVAPKYPGYVDRELNVIRLASVRVAKQPETRLATHLPDKSLMSVLSLDFDIIHGHSGGPVTFIGWEIARSKKIPFVVTYHTLWNRYTHYILKGKIVTPKMMERATKIFGNRTDCLIAPSVRVEEELRHYGVKKPIAVVPSGLDVDKFANAPAGFLRGKIGVARAPIILFTGRLGREKSIGFLIRTFEIILKNEPSAHFAIIGDGPERKKLESQAMRLNVSKNTHFVGDIKNDDMYKVYKDASVFVFASTTETQGLVVPEALASGVPVVAVDDPALESIKNGLNGFLVKKDKIEFAIKTLAVLKNKALHGELSKNAFLSSQEFNVNSTVNLLEEIYYKLVDENNRLSTRRIMADNLRSEQLFVLNIFFWLTVVTARFSAFLFYKPSYLYPALNAAGSFFTLAGLGFIIFLLGAALSISKKTIGLLSLVLFGIGGGLIIDNLASIILLRTSVSFYWDYLNLVPILFFGILPLLFLKTAEGVHPRLFANPKKQVHINPLKPKVSVVIPAYNEQAFIEVTLRSVLAQTYKNFELIVVDNNSTDKTGEIAARYGARVIVEKQKGVAWARQAGFIEARGEIIASTDSDSIVPENWLEKIVAGFESDPKIVGYGGLGYLYSGPLTARAAGRYLFPAFWVIDRFLSGGWNLNGFNMACARDAFSAIGGFRTDMTMGEDIDLAKRLRAQGRVSVDTAFAVFVSGRRYKDGLLKGIMVYAPSYIMRVFFKKDEFLTFPTVRSEKSIGPKLTYLPVSTVILFLFALFYLSRARG